MSQAKRKKTRKTAKKKAVKAIKRQPAKKRSTKRQVGATSSRASTEVERNQRLARVARLRFVQHWSFPAIAQHEGVTTRTIARDLTILRNKYRKRWEGNVEHRITDIVQGLSLSYDEKLKLLWNEFIKITTKEGGSSRRLSIPARYQALNIIKRITDTESNYIEQLRKLGIVDSGFESGDGEDGSFLLQIKARHAKIISSHGTAGGGNVKPSSST